MMILQFFSMIKDKDQSWKSFIIETLILIGIVLFIRFYIFQFFRVSGPSMCPTLNILNGECQYDEGEFIFVNEFLYNFIRDPQKGEIVVFHPPEKKEFYIKRIIGVPGDTIDIIDGKVYLTNDTHTKLELPESYLSAVNQGQTQSHGQSSFTVPEGHFLLFGDNRNKSFDGRHCYNLSGCDGSHSPFIPAANITGKASFIIWPLSKIRFLENELESLTPNEA